MGETLSKDLDLMGFKHIFYLTTDRTGHLLRLTGELIWFPSIPLESMDKQLRKSIIEDQLTTSNTYFDKKMVRKLKFNNCSQILHISHVMLD